jgi:hypothetical protein
MKLFCTLPLRIVISMAATMLVLLFTPAIASANISQPVSITASGGQLTGRLLWTGPNSFELRDMALTDTRCDAQPVFFSVSFNGHDGPWHTNTGGCASTTTFPTLKGADGFRIPTVTFNMCRGTSIPQCDKLVYAPV